MRISDNYLTDMRAVAQTDPGFRARTARRMLEVGSNIAYRNRALYDAWRLLRGEDWSDDPHWELTGLRDLPRERPLPEGIPADLKEQISQAVERAISETPASFAELQDQRPDPANTAAYMEWFYRYIPYLTLNLAPTEAGLETAWERLRWFRDALPQDAEILRDAISDNGRRYISDWYDTVAPAP